VKSISSIRNLGRDYCQTEGSSHYKEGGIEPIDLIISKGLIEDFCLANIIKYATRFKKTRNLEDLKKVSDYSHILCGVELSKVIEVRDSNSSFECFCDSHATQEVDDYRSCSNCKYDDSEHFCGSCDTLSGWESATQKGD